MHNHVRFQFVEDATTLTPPEIDLAGEIRRSGFSAVCQVYGVDSLVTHKPGGYYNHQLQALAFEDALLKQNHMRRALTMKDLETAHAQRQPIIIQSAEGAQFLEGRIDRIQEAYRHGFRHLQILHEQDDPVSPAGDVYTAPAHLGGLTAFGAEVIRECNRIGIVVDLAHATSDTILAGVKAASAPLIVSHPGLFPGPGQDWSSPEIARRLVSRDAAHAVAEAGGVIGVWSRVGYTMREYVETVRRTVDIVGIDHVGIGTDTDLTSSYMLPYTNRIWPDENGGFFFSMVGEMLKQGFTEEEIGKVGGGNFCRVFAKVTAGHA